MNSKIRLLKLVKILCFLPLLAGLSGTVIAQHQISGTVTEAITGEALPGVSVIIQGTARGTATELDGTYSLTAPSGDVTLLFSYIGFENQQIEVQGRNVIDVQMEQASIMGEDVLVVGYGIQRAEDVTSSIISVPASEFRVSAPKDAASLIKGRVAGLNIQEPSGNPTDGTQIKLRGTTTLTGSSSPLVLIDGIPGGLNSVAPENIESITVLKDGSAAAIYGSRGTNGVILITTKGYEGQTRPTITYQGFMDYQQIVNTPDMFTADEYRDVINNQGAPFTDFGESTDWIESVLREPVSQNHSLTYSGGNSQTNYSANLNYRDQQGIFLRSDSEDLRTRVSLNHSIREDLVQVNLNLNYRIQEFFNGSRDDGSFNNSVWRQAVIRNPTDQVRNEQGGWQERPGFGYSNPLGLLNAVEGDTENREFKFDGSVTFNPLTNLSITAVGSTTRFNSLRGYAESFEHRTTTVDGLNGWASRNEDTEVDNLFELTANFSQNIDAHSVQLLGGYSWQEVVFEGFNAFNQNFPTDLFSYNNLGLGVDLQEGLAGMGSYKNSYKLIGFFSRLNYDYDGRYLLMGSMRYEGNSRFGADNEWGLFPAVSAGWRISSESFMEDFDFINELKLRAGFGVTGIAPNESYLSLTSYDYSGFFFNQGEWVQGIEPARNPNPDLKWERKDEINLGLDFELFERVRGNIDVYRRDTKDLLFEISVPVPPFVFPDLLANDGELRNEGIEVALDVDAYQSENINWTSSVVYSTNRNELISLGEGSLRSEQDFIYAGGLGESVQLPTHRIDVGGKVGNFYGYKAVDIDEDGNWIIENAEGERKGWFDIEPDDRQVIGNGLPDHNISWRNSVNYKNFDLSILLRGAFGFQILNETSLFYSNPTQQDFNLLSDAFDPIFGKEVLNNEWAYVDYYLEDGDFVKIDDVTLGYNLSSLPYGISNLRVYLSGQNLHTFTGYSGLDPEVSIGGLNPGHDFRDRYPTTRRFTLGVNVTF